ncbi:Pleckstrin y domain-containing family B member 2 [Araneus ventricosus]|uniref:Pleckstrin y domain-containing family B member 2 n=1 Tax=Araneus ventricosus TaxID=182803 RepID=A0A4Y2EBM9_ARAVE|nr:Pleckstrin y domain-containing family B member 2 [Araneus ventricosus]
MDNSVIAKSGWLSRQTSILKKWKKSWVELYRDGHLKYYENECSPNAEDIIFMPTECLAVKAGLQVEGVQPPEGYGVQNLLSVITSTGKTWVFCGESLDDMRAWQLALEQARIFGMHPHLSGHPSAYMSGYNSGYLPTYTELGGVATADNLQNGCKSTLSHVHPTGLVAVVASGTGAWSSILEINMTNQHEAAACVFTPVSVRWSAARCLWRKFVLLASVSCGQRDENLREPSQDCRVGDQKLPIQNAAGGSLLQL